MHRDSNSHWSIATAFLFGKQTHWPAEPLVVSSTLEESPVVFEKNVGLKSNMT